MAEKRNRKYPVGIQSFERIRKSGCLYVDKTPLIYKLVSGEAPTFLSRPRRFGKSLLISTLEALFQGRRELFEEMTLKDGTVQPRLFIATTDWDWQPRSYVPITTTRATRGSCLPTWRLHKTRRLRST